MVKHALSVTRQADFAAWYQDVIAEADWLLDMGPEGGTGGGQLVCEGTPEQVEAARDHSHTGRVLGPLLRPLAQTAP